MVWGLPLDYMHTILLGIVLFLCNLWCELFFNKHSIRLIDERMSSIKPPREVHNLPELFSERSKYKAKDWKTWMLYLRIPILLDILPTNNLQ